MTHNAGAIVAGRVGANAGIWVPGFVAGKDLDLTTNRDPLRRVASASVFGLAAGRAKALRGAVRAITHTLNGVAVRCGKLMGKTSLSSRDLRVHFDVAIVLISIIPMLVFTYVFLFDPSMVVRGVAFSTSLALVALGYWLISKYPKTLLRLHDYLRSVANGEMPRVACLMEEEKDIVATERYLNLILDVMREKVRTIEQQKQRIAEIERKKAIAESLATACHYLGQPATVIVAYLDIMEKERLSPAMKGMLSQCQIAGASIARILHALNHATACQAEPYLPDDKIEDGKPGEMILSIAGLSDYETGKIL